MKEKTIRIAIYLIGIIILAFGLILNTKCALGTSAIVSIAYVGAEITGWTIGDVTLVEYVIFIGFEMIVHLLHKKEKSVIVMDLLQLPFSLLFSRFMNLFSNWIPSFGNSEMLIRILVLVVAIALTGLGACMMLAMKLIPNPADGVVATIAETMNKDMGLVKNGFDVLCLLITCLLCWGSGHSLDGIGIGTLMAILGVGRFLSFYNHLFKSKMLEASGLN